MQMFVKLLSGLTVVVEVERHYDILELKELICENVPPFLRQFE